jgi:hypothetical protein
VLVSLDRERGAGVAESLADDLHGYAGLRSDVGWVWRTSWRRMSGTPACRAGREADLAKVAHASRTRRKDLIPANGEATLLTTVQRLHRVDGSTSRVITRVFLASSGPAACLTRRASRRRERKLACASCGDAISPEDIRLDPPSGRTPDASPRPALIVRLITCALTDRTIRLRS